MNTVWEGYDLRTAAKMKPILFSGPMVRAILDGRKTQTRRVLKPSNTLFNGSAWHKEAKVQEWNWKNAWVDPGPSPVGNPGPYMKLPWLSGDEVYRDTVHRIYPAVQLGDLLWVRETWQTHCDKDDIKPSDLPKDSAIQYPATYDGWVSKKRSSMFMPQWASRITLRVTGVKVERLQDITEEQAKAEGAHMDNEGCDHPRHTCKEAGCIGSDWKGYRAGFADIWFDIHGPGSWTANPWVAAYTFERITC